jgi:CubicO group peptidase (beta-lactamase class C family)
MIIQNIFNAETRRRGEGKLTGIKGMDRDNKSFSLFLPSLLSPPSLFNKFLRLCVSAFLFIFLVAAVGGQSLPVALPQAVGMSAEKLKQIDALVEQDIADKKLPGAVVVVGHKGKIVYRKAFGNRSLAPTVEKMTVDTIFDVASLTKPVATATSIMILVEQGKLRLNDTVGRFIPEIQDEAAKRVTIQQLLTHTSGYRPDFDLGEKWAGREGMLAALKKEKLRNPPGTRFVYSDIGFIVLGEIVQRVSGLNAGVAATTINGLGFGGLELKNTFFGRLVNEGLYGFTSYANDTTPYHLTKRIAPTENIKGQQNYLGSKWEGDEKTGNEILRGMVHDPTAFRMNGIAGHAGLFSTADDLARYCQMLLNGGVLDGKRILSTQTVARMTAPYVVSEDGATRGLGWDMNTSFSANRGELFPLGSFGHTGFTGTSVWIDRVSQTFVVFLSNRVHPDGKGDVTPLRARVATVVASAIEDTPIEKFREAEADYNAIVAAQIPKFREQVEAADARNAAIRNPQSAIVLNGIDVLEKNNFKELSGLKIGLVTNHTGRNLAGKPTIDVLKEAKNVNLVALFAPEHGIRGQLDQEKISDSVDEKTGTPAKSRRRRFRHSGHRRAFLHLHFDAQKRDGRSRQSEKAGFRSRPREPDQRRGRGRLARRQR